MRARIAFLRARSLVTVNPSGQPHALARTVSAHSRETRESATLVLVAGSSVGGTQAQSGQARLPLLRSYARPASGQAGGVTGHERRPPVEPHPAPLTRSY